ncbi:MAG TPA: hypothetical protein VFP41_05645 [Actinomycetota bacterium]|nr:hypothetical protein [Actinomycetota bacterium]
MPIDAPTIAEEDRLWGELRSTIDAFDPHEAVRPGYFAEGWSAKDGLAHIGTWLAEAGVALEQIRHGTYVELHADEIDEMNARFLDAMRDVSLADVKAQAAAARSRMLHAWGQFPSPDEAATSWIRKAGPEHYREHLPRLQAWLAELHGE